MRTATRPAIGDMPFPPQLITASSGSELALSHVLFQAAVALEAAGVELQKYSIQHPWSPQGRGRAPQKLEPPPPLPAEAKRH